MVVILPLIEVTPQRRKMELGSDLNPFRQRLATKLTFC
jgi:hypothetical protein